MTGIKEEIRRFITDNYLGKGADARIGDEDSFLKKGIIDSMGVLELVNFIQDKFSIKVSAQEILPQNFDTLSNIERFISMKKGNS